MTKGCLVRNKQGLQNRSPVWENFCSVYDQLPDNSGGIQISNPIWNIFETLDGIRNWILAKCNCRQFLMWFCSATSPCITVTSPCITEVMNWSHRAENRVTVKIWSQYLQYLQNYLEILISLSGCSAHAGNRQYVIGLSIYLANARNWAESPELWSR